MKTLQEAALDAFGFEKQVIALGEEAGELAAAACRFVNNKGDHRALLEEIIGVAFVAKSLRPALDAIEPGAYAAIEKAQEAKLAAKIGWVTQTNVDSTEADHA